MLWQSLGQICGYIFVHIIYKFTLPSKENYFCSTDYILPFDGKWTVINGGVDKSLSHAWGIATQRYAYDFFIVDNDGKSLDGDNQSLQSYYCYGKDVLAPADGEVVKISNKHKDSRVNGKKAYCDTWDIRGNFIVMKHAEHEYSLIAHLMPDSISVNIGDMVKQGTLIAKCGNSGNTSQPHIHFQIQTGESFFISAGLPVAFCRISTQIKANYELIDKRKCQGNLQTSNENVYIGRGLEVENIV